MFGGVADRGISVIGDQDFVAGCKLKRIENGIASDRRVSTKARSAPSHPTKAASVDAACRSAVGNS